MEKLNKEYVAVVTKMRELNEKRRKIYSEFKKIQPKNKLKGMTTISLYHDLFGNDLDLEVS